MKNNHVVTTVVFAAFALTVSFLFSLTDSISQLTSRFIPIDLFQTSFTLLGQNQTLSISRQTPSSDPLTESSPWTHPPICTPDIPSLSSPLCVYTISTFNNSTGLCLFTTPSIAQEVTQLPSILHPSPLPLFPSPPPYNLTALPNKGHGLIATHPIPRLTTLLTTHPILIMHSSPDLSTELREKYLRIAISQLPPSTQHSYYALTKHYDIPEVAAQDVVKANAFEIGLPQPPVQGRKVNGVEMHLAIFPEAARMNHDCAPNAMYYLDGPGLRHVVSVTRDMAVGEELTLGYVNVLQERSQRQRMLMEGWGFECGCARCVRERKQEDLRKGQGEHEGQGAVLKEIKDLQRKLSEWVVHKSELRSTDLSSSHSPSLSPSSSSSSLPPTRVAALNAMLPDTAIQATLSTYLSLHHRLGVQGFMDDSYKLAAVVMFLLAETSEENSSSSSSSSPPSPSSQSSVSNQGDDQDLPHNHDQNHWGQRREIHSQAKNYARLVAETTEMRFGPASGDIDAWKTWGMEDEAGDGTRELEGAEWVVRQYVEGLRVRMAQ